MTSSATIRGSQHFGSGLVLPAHRGFYDLPSGELGSPQAKAFGLYLVRAAIRGAFLSAQAIAAADVLLEQEFFAAATALYYTAAYHGLAGYLAQNGRVFIEQVRGVPVTTRTVRGASTSIAWISLPRKGSPATICAMLRRGGGWTFERRERTHAARWREIRQCFAKNDPLPIYLEDLLRYAVSDWDGHASRDDLLSEGLPLLTRMRHQALYEGFGYDDESYDLQVNPEGVGDLSLRARQLRALAVGLLIECFDVAEVLLSYPTFHGQNGSMFLVVMLPPFEMHEELPAKLDAALQPRLAKLLQWFGWPRDA